MVFIMTDGEPTDDYRSGIAEFKSYKWGTVIACIIGPYADQMVLREITENVVVLERGCPIEIAAFFQWISLTISATCNNNELPPPPSEITLGITPAKQQYMTETRKASPEEMAGW